MTPLTIETVTYKNARKRPLNAPPRVFKRKSKGKPKKAKVSQEKVWKLKKADNHFSLWIRARDGRCMHPIGCNRTTMLQCSHYFGRAIKSTRFDPDNCITLCWLHHYKDKLLGFEYQKQTFEKHGFDGQYTWFMRNHLGEERYNALCERAKQSIKQKAAIFAYQNKLKEL